MTHYPAVFTITLKQENIQKRECTSQVAVYIHVCPNLCNKNVVKTPKDSDKL